MVFLPLILALFGLDLDLGYLCQLARGQMGLLVKQEPIEKVLRRDDLDPETARRLRFVQDVRSFGVDALGLEESKNYTTFVDVEGDAVVWNLTVAPQDRLEPLTWNYPVVGRVPYRGYFKQNRARAEADEWEARGYDVYLRPVGAYSTLGWFTDPVLSTMLRYSDDDLASVVLHEMTHATVWIEGDVEFNESLATFIGDAGAIAYLEEIGGGSAEAAQRADQRRVDGERFRRRMHELAIDLMALYGEDHPRSEMLNQRTGLFDETRRSLEEEDWLSEAYAGAGRIELNNARVAAYRIYHTADTIFKEIEEAMDGDLRRALKLFRECESSRNPRGYLRRWLYKQKEE